MGPYAVAALLMVAQGTIEQELAKCAAVTGAVERLDCFDKLARGTKTGQNATPASPANSKDDGWTVQAEPSPIDDSEVVWASRLSQTKNATLVVQCRGKKRQTDVLIHWTEAVGPEDDEEVPVTTRIGSAKPHKSEWQISEDHRTTYYLGSTKDLARRLMGGTQFVAQVSSYSAIPAVAMFNLAGAAVAIEEVKEACAWKD